MIKFSQAAFERAKNYLYTNGRILDQRRYEYHFEGGSHAAVVEALAAFQNEDGGFGRGLEPDLRTMASSVIATSTAFGILREIGASARKPAVQLGVQYLLDTYDKEKGVWPIIPPEVEDAPHAWWWSYEDSEKNFGGFLVNPRAAVAGHLQHYSSLVRPDFLAKVKTAVLEQLDSFSDSIALHDFDCYLGLAEADGLAKAEQQRIVAKLVQLLPNSLEMDRDKWAAGEVFKPLVVAPRPDSVLSGAVDDELVQENLDIEIDGQLENGSWPLGWDWSPIDQAAWNAAERDWKGYIIVNKLRMFRAYGRWKGSN
jgi:hypothetical protein